MINKLFCSRCGEIIENEDALYIHEASVTHCYCSEACAEAEGFHQCEECGEWVPNCELGYVSGLGDLCLDRLENNCVCCEKCGEWIDKDDARETPDGDFSCEDCFDDTFAECCHC